MTLSPCWTQVCSPSFVFSAHDSMVTSILLIKTRPKMSKTSPFPKRNNPMKKEKEAMMKSMPGMAKASKDKKIDRPMFIDSPGIKLLVKVKGSRSVSKAGCQQEIPTG